MQVTFLSCWHPYPADNGAKQRALALIAALAPEHTIDLIVLNATGQDTRDPGPLAEYCRAITTLAVPVFRHDNSRSFHGYFSPAPRSLVLTDTPAVTTLIRRRIVEGRCDALFCACADLRAGYYGMKFAHHVPVIIDELEPSRYVDAIRHASSLRARARAELTAWKYRQFIRALLDKSAGCFLSSSIEARLIYRTLPDSNHVVIVPNGVMIEQELSPMARDPHRLVYNGSPTYAPNLDAVRYFAGHILPHIRVSHPEAWFAVTGATSGADTDSLKGRPDVVFTEWLADIRAYVASSRVCVVPLRHGGGTRLKILEAMAAGTPVVATHKAAEGLMVTDGEDILIADSPEAFARATVRLLDDDALYERIAAHARLTVATRYDWSRIGAGVSESFGDFVRAWENKRECSELNTRTEKRARG